MGVVTVEQVEAAAFLVPARTNGAKPEPPAPLEEAPKQSSLVRTATATFADSDLSTAQKVLALGLGSCRWPYGDPRHPDFHFCGSPVARKSYCEQHHALAYVADSGHGARIPKGAHHAAALVALSVPPAGAPNRRSIR